MPPAAEAARSELLIVANLERSSVNMADRYGRVIRRPRRLPGSVGLKVMSMGLIATYGDHDGPRLLLGRRDGAPPQPFAAGAGRQRTGQQHPGLRRPAAADRHHPPQHQRRRSADRAQAARVVGQLRRRRRDLGGEEPDRVRTGLGSEALSPALGGVERNALFDKPRDLFIVIYLQSLPRRCALDSPACLVDGRKPTDIFLETDASGAAAWLNFAGPGIKPAQLLHVSIATSESESLDAFRKRCGEVPVFPAPSST